MALCIKVLCAANLPNVETFGTIDPYVQVRLQGVKKKTTTKDDTCDPEWNEMLEFDLEGAMPKPDDMLELQVKDYESLGRNRLLGSCCVSLMNAMNAGRTVDYELQLLDNSQRPTTGTLKLSITFKKPATMSTTSETGQDQALTGDQTDSGGTVIPQTPPTGGGGGSTAGGGMPGGGSGRPSVTRSQLPNKQTKFQIRVKIVEARQLVGSGINPVSRIKSLGDLKQTQVKRSTQCPWFDELFFFHKEMLPEELFKECIEFQVCNSHMVRSDSIIGSYKCDFGIIYDQPSHAYVNRWTILGNPEEPVSGVMGYLKISIVVLGPGDEAPSFAISKDDDDIESNLLWPTGVTLEPAFFSVEVYQAQDLPRMDSGAMQNIKETLGFGSKSKSKDKENVDPYMVCSYAGREVESKTLYCTENPMFSQTLHVGFLFPSMCNNIMLRLFDWDRVGSNDVIATSYISIPSISAEGDDKFDGYLPQFGPCFVNFYGSNREFGLMTSDEDEDRNYGKGEGCGYRGRALVSVKTNRGAYPDQPVTNMDSDVLLKVARYQQVRHYIINVVFLSATMISVIDKPVEFEVSMGKYGNKFEDDVMPSPSSTNPTNAVYDGNGYYFLPWDRNKPLVMVRCEWEDISHRLFSLNVLLGVQRTLERGIKRLKILIKSNRTVEASREFAVIVDQFIRDCTDCRNGLDKAGSTPTASENSLDRAFRERRSNGLQRMMEQATKLKQEGLTDLSQSLDELGVFLNKLKELTDEPQNSMPDIIIWMISGKERIGYIRVPAHTVLFSRDEQSRGHGCGMVQAICLKSAKKKSGWKIPALIRVRIWLGKENELKYWRDAETNTEVTTFAETYENQVNLGTWTSRGPLLTRPKFSDSDGQQTLPREAFTEPVGWKFSGDWFVDPEPSMQFDMDAGHKKFMEDVFENEMRVPGGKWIQALTQWTDVKGDPATPREEIKCPEAWEWDDAWQWDMARAVDEEGWEYCLESTMGGWGPQQKMYHLCRRRRWVRTRSVNPEKIKKKKKDKKGDDLGEGWEYAPMFNLRFHRRERAIDRVRRRRWHRKLVVEDLLSGALPVLQLKIEDKEIPVMISPRMYIEHKEESHYQLRLYIFQARNLLAGDKTGFSDPYAMVCFMNKSQRTELEKKTLCPTWDQTLIFEKIAIVGKPDLIKEQPPDIFVEIFDYDDFGEPEFLGRTSLKPAVWLDQSKRTTQKLAWHTIRRQDEPGGELLATAELFLEGVGELPFVPPRRGDLFTVPAGVRPIVQRTAVEILCWGLRSMKTYELQPIRCPSVEFECGGKVVSSPVMKNIRVHPNFDDPALFLELMLPEEALYMPALNVKVRDHRSFGAKPIVGTCVITMHEFRVAALEPEVDSLDGTISPPPRKAHSAIDIKEDEEEVLKEDADIDWWCKYYVSEGDGSKGGNYLDKGYETMEVYKTELEKVERFRGFKDFLSSFPLRRGKSQGDESDIVGEFKGTLRIYPLPGDPTLPMPCLQLKGLPSAASEEVLVRLYVVRGNDLAPKDPGGLADPYVVVKLGNVKKNSKKEYRPATLNPMFGHVFEMSATLPQDKDMCVSVYDYDIGSGDDLIGETVIDLENRYLTRFRATCGLPKKYHILGPNRWRDSKVPSAILSEVCATTGKPKPRWVTDEEVTVGTEIYRLVDFEASAETSPSSLGPEKERLALAILHKMKLTPEHVETRRLYHKSSPGLEQGTVQLWVDMFPKSHGTPPPPVNITPRKPNRYVLRIVIWNAYDVILEDVNIMGDKMSDVFVTGFMQGVKEKQNTDVHYRCLNGEANFNWRMVFEFDYIEAEHMMVVTKKSIWNIKAKEQKLLPRIVLQLCDADLISADDQLGECILDLNKLPPPAKKAKDITLESIATKSRPAAETNPTSNGRLGSYMVLPCFRTEDGQTVQPIDLFEKKRLHGFWPCVSYNEAGETIMAGKLQMDMEILSEEEAKEKPAGLGRDEPNLNPVLAPPERPATSFAWFQAPWKAFQFILWKKYKWYIITFIIFLFLLIFTLLFLYSLPGAITDSLIGVD